MIALRLSIACLCLCCWGCSMSSKNITTLPPLPDPEGFAGGFAGTSHGALLFAGGSNFPGKKPWEGGKKVWYDAIYVLESPTGKWTRVGQLPRAHGYGPSVSYNDGVICIGGGDSDRNMADVLRLEWVDSKVVIKRMPSLPRPLANACAAIVGDTVFLAGGQESPTATTSSRGAYSLDLRDPSATWKEIAQIPGPGRILATAASCDGAFWVIGGAELSAEADGKPQRKYLTDAHRFDANKGWTRVADLPRPSVAAPSPAAVDASGFYVLGGDDGSAVNTPPAQHPGFSRDVYRYDLATARWSLAPQLGAGHVTTPLVSWRQLWVIPSGEVRPGKRTPEVLVYQPTHGEPR